ncbi:hypothetical protein V8C26DRAFT_17736 [Trichoderma gracile]
MVGDAGGRMFLVCVVFLSCIIGTSLNLWTNSFSFWKSNRVLAPVGSCTDVGCKASHKLATTPEEKPRIIYWCWAKVCVRLAKDERAEPRILAKPQPRRH